MEAVHASAETINVDVSIGGFLSPDKLHENPNKSLESVDTGLLRAMLNTGEISNEEFAEAILAKREN